MADQHPLGMRAFGLEPRRQEAGGGGGDDDVGPGGRVDLAEQA